MVRVRLTEAVAAGVREGTVQRRTPPPEGDKQAANEGPWGPEFQAVEMASTEPLRWEGSWKGVSWGTRECAGYRLGAGGRQGRRMPITQEQDWNHREPRPPQGLRKGMKGAHPRVVAWKCRFRIESRPLLEAEPIQLSTDWPGCGERAEARIQMDLWLVPGRRWCHSWEGQGWGS